MEPETAPIAVSATFFIIILSIQKPLTHECIRHSVISPKRDPIPLLVTALSHSCDPPTAVQLTVLNLELIKIKNMAIFYILLKTLFLLKFVRFVLNSHVTVL